MCAWKRHTMIKDTTRIPLITRIIQWQQNEACLFNDVTVFLLFFYFFMFTMEIYIFTRTMQLRLSLIAWLRICDVDTHAHTNLILSRRDDDVRIINFEFYTYTRWAYAPTGRIKVQGQYDTYRYICVYIDIYIGDELFHFHTRYIFHA